MLLIYPGLLARYDQLDLLERLRDRVGRRAAPGAVAARAGDQQAVDRREGRAAPQPRPAGARPRELDREPPPGREERELTEEARP